MDNFFYAYKLTWFNEDSMNEEKSEGLIYAATYADALKNISDDYGDDVICNITLECLSDGGHTIEFSELKSYLNK